MMREGCVAPPLRAASWTMMPSSPRHRRHNRYLASVLHFRSQPLQVADIVRTHKNIQVLPHFVLLGHHAVAQPRVHLPKSSERLIHRLSARTYRHIGPPARVRLQIRGNAKYDRHGLLAPEKPKHGWCHSEESAINLADDEESAVSSGRSRFLTSFGRR